MRTVLIATAAVLVVAAVGAQFVLPPLAESDVEERLERGGGDVQAQVSAFPALRLLFEDGDSLEVEGSGLSLDLLDEPGDAFEKLDGFGEVRIVLDDLEAGPVRLERFELVRAEDDEAYDLSLRGETSARELARYLGGQAGGSLGALLGDAIAGTTLPEPAAPLPVQLEAEVESDEGRADATSVSGSVAGIPAGPLVEIVVDAVVRRL